MRSCDPVLSIPEGCFCDPGGTVVLEGGVSLLDPSGILRCADAVYALPLDESERVGDHPDNGSVRSEHDEGWPVRLFRDWFFADHDCQGCEPNCHRH